MDFIKEICILRYRLLVFSLKLQHTFNSSFTWSSNELVWSWIVRSKSSHVSLGCIPLSNLKYRFLQRLKNNSRISFKWHTATSVSSIVSSKPYHLLRNRLWRQFRLKYIYRILVIVTIASVDWIYIFIHVVC